MSRARLYFATGLSAAGLIVGGMASLSVSAVAAPGSDAACPAPFLAADLTLGQPVTGLTTAGSYSRGGVEQNSTTTPEEFTGVYRGSVDNPTGDLLIFELEGSRITKADGSLDAGIWAGISGSPLYSADGRLIGSVSYGFSGAFGTTFAGVTPAAALYDLLDDEASGARARVKLSTGEQKSLVRKGLPRAAAQDGLRRLDPPMTLAGVRHGDPKTLARIAERSGLAAPLLGGGTAANAAPVPIVPGSNFAAADSYGTVSFYSVGTTTAVCDDVAIAYGHPADFAPSRKSVHGATTTFIQADGARSYKMANLAAPAGTLTGDHLAGITALLGPVPDSVPVTSAVIGGRPRNSVSHVVNPDALGFVANNQAYLDTIMALDQDAGGEVLMSWTISYRRANGTNATFTRTQRYSDSSGLAELVTTDVGTDIDAIVDNEFEDVTVTGVQINETVSKQTKVLKVGSVEHRKSGNWRAVARTATVRVVPGKNLKIRVNLVPADRESRATPISRVMSFKVPKKAARRGKVTVSGNAAEIDDWFFFFDDFESNPDKDPKSFDELLAALKKQPRQDSVTVKVVNRMKTGDKRKIKRTWRTPSVTNGDYGFKTATRGAKKNKKPRG